MFLFTFWACSLIRTPSFPCNIASTPRRLNVTQGSMYPTGGEVWLASRLRVSCRHNNCATLRFFLTQGSFVARNCRVHQHVIPGDMSVHRWRSWPIGAELLGFGLYTALGRAVSFITPSHLARPSLCCNSDGWGG